MRKMTQKEKIRQYEDFLHKINIAQTCMNSKMIQQLVSNANAWSYAHRVGNGGNSEKEQQELIDNRCRKLCDTTDN